MKRRGILTLILCVCSVLAASAQQSSVRRLRTQFPRHHAVNQAAQSADVSQPYLLQSSTSQNFWELGAYPGGTWADLGDINDLGLAVGVGGVPPDGNTHTLAVPVFGPHAGQWIDLGTLGGEYTGWEEPLNRVSDTGIIVGHSATSSGYVHGFVWTEKSGIVDLGTLADIGYKKYNSSYAAGINKLGTLIVGWSGIEQSCLDCAVALPVVWTPSVECKSGEFVTKWKIHKLDTAGFPNLARWYAWSVNDFGQIIAATWNYPETIGTAIVWNPLPNGKGWKATSIFTSTDFPYMLPFTINDRGQITGGALVADTNITFPPVFWKPLSATRKTYSPPIMLALPAGFVGGYTDGINELGDMTGELWGDAGDQAFRWRTADPNFVEMLNPSLDWSYSFGVSNARIAAIAYAGANCTVDRCGGAIQLH